MIFELNHKTWGGSLIKKNEQRLLKDIEEGKVVFLPQLNFDLFPHEAKFLSPDCVDSKVKNVSYDPQTYVLRGSSCPEEDNLQLQGMMTRFAHKARALIDSFFPFYREGLQWGKTSFRPVEALGRKVSSYRKDDTRLHVDAFASQPVQGRRLLRVFSNINPHNTPRVWHLGESFEDVVQKFLHHLRPGSWISSALLQKLGITKGYRTPYDSLMLKLHNAMKADQEYQKATPYLEVLFPSRSTWIVMTDKVSHAALSGQFLLEQTFYLPVSSMHSPAQSPLHILEKTLGRKLV